MQNIKPQEWYRLGSRNSSPMSTPLVFMIRELWAIFELVFSFFPRACWFYSSSFVWYIYFFPTKKGTLSLSHAACMHVWNMNFRFCLFFDRFSEAAEGWVTRAQLKIIWTHQIYSWKKKKHLDANFLLADCWKMYPSYVKLLCSGMYLSEKWSCVFWCNCARVINIYFWVLKC